jgi:hypothetical protein
MSAYTQLGAPIDVTPTDDGTYQDVDVTSYVSNASGVLLRVSHADTSARSFALRKNGSTDDYYADVWDDHHTYYAVGIDSSDIFECKLESITPAWSIELIGYFDADDVTFLTNAVEAPTTTGAWTDWDISSETGTDTAIAAICFVYAPYTTSNVGFRKNGSTDDRTNDTAYNTLVGGVVVGVDGAEILEYYRENTSIDPMLTGYFTAGVTMNTNATDISLSTTGSWTDLSSLGTDIDGIFVEVVSSTSSISWGLRPDGDADYDGHYADLTRQHAWSSAGAVSDVVEGKIEGTAVDFFLLGTVDADAGTEHTLTPSAGAINAEGSTPSLRVENALSPVSGAVTIEGNTPTVDAGAAISLEPTTGAVDISGAAPGLEVINDLSALVGEVTIGGAEPGVLVHNSLNPDSGAVDITGNTPVVTAVAGEHLEPESGAVNITGNVPSVFVEQNLTPAAGVINVAGQTPAVSVDTEAVSLLPETGRLTVTGMAPTVSVGPWVPVTKPTDGWTDVAGSTGVWADVSPSSGTWSDV